MSTKGNAKFVAEILRFNYNQLYRRRNPQAGRFYDVYTAGRTRNNAKECFEKLAGRLIRRNIPPQLYLQVLCNYGKFRTMKFLPMPSWLVKKKTITIYEWMLRAESAKYSDEETMRKSLNGSKEISEGEICEAVRESAKIAKGKPSPVLFALRDTVSDWYLALRDDFLKDGKIPPLEKSRLRDIKRCRSYYRSNPRLFTRAKLAKEEF